MDPFSICHMIDGVIGTNDKNPKKNSILVLKGYGFKIMHIILLSSISRMEELVRNVIFIPIIFVIL